MLCLKNAGDYLEKRSDLYAVIDDSKNKIKLYMCHKQISLEKTRGIEEIMAEVKIQSAGRF